MAIPKELLEQSGIIPNSYVGILPQDGYIVIAPVEVNPKFPQRVNVPVGKSHNYNVGSSHSGNNPSGKVGNRESGNNPNWDVTTSFKRGYEYKPGKPKEPPKEDNTIYDINKIVETTENELKKINKEYIEESDLKRLWATIKKKTDKIKNYNQFKNLLLNGMPGLIDSILYEPEPGKYKLL